MAYSLRVRAIGRRVFYRGKVCVQTRIPKHVLTSLFLAKKLYNATYFAKNSAPFLDRSRGGSSCIDVGLFEFITFNIDIDLFM